MRGSQSHPTRETKALLPPVGWDRMGAGVGGKSLGYSPLGQGFPSDLANPGWRRGLLSLNLGLTWACPHPLEAFV